MIIGFAGKKRVGKTTSANYLVDMYGFDRYAFADPIKEVAKMLFGWDDSTISEYKEQKCPVWGLTPREFLQWFGTDIMRIDIVKQFTKYKPGGNFWVEKMVNDFKNYPRFLTIDDVRFQNEIDAIKKLGGIIVKINRNVESLDEHASENQELKRIDYVIENTKSIEALYRRILEIMEIEQDRLFRLSEQG